MAERLSILIAEDNAADRMLLSTIVSRQGHRVLTASNGLEAVALFEQERPQLVLMDALMPIMDGFEAARRIKQVAGEELVPIIFLTSLTEGEALVRCLEAGGDDFLAKPYNRVILEAKIKAMDRLRRLQDTVLQQRDLIAMHNEHLLTEQRVAKAVFDKVTHSGCLDCTEYPLPAITLCSVQRRSAVGCVQTVGWHACVAGGFHRPRFTRSDWGDAAG